MPDDFEPLQYFVCRVFAATPVVIVEIRVSLATALEWCPDLQRYPGLLRAYADGEAVRRVRDALHERGVAAGRWCATFPGGDRVEMEATR